MIVVDSSVWIDYFRGKPTPQSERLSELISDGSLLFVGDLVLAEVLRGFTNTRECEQARHLLTSYQIIDLAGKDIAISSVNNYRRLRERGVTVRSLIDTIIATRCIQDGYELLHSDRDFEPFVTHLGLQVVV